MFGRSQNDEQIRSLNYRLDKTEQDLVNSIKSLESKMNAIAELSQSMTALNQRTLQHTDQLTETKLQLRETIEISNRNDERLQQRLDEMSNNIRDKLDLVSRETVMRIKSVEEKADKTERDFKQWLNRGVGAWFILSIVAASVQFIFYQWNVENVSQMEKIQMSDQQLSTTVARQSTQIDEIEVHINLLRGDVTKLNAQYTELLRSTPLK